MDDLRMKKLQQWVRKEGIDALLIEDSIDLFYLTGLSLSAGCLATFPSNALLFVDGRYLEQAKKYAPCPVFPQGEITASLQDVRRIGFDGSSITIHGLQVLQKKIPDKKWISFVKPLKTLRWVKDSRELASLRSAAKLTWEGYQHLLRQLQGDVSERELAVEFECVCRRWGAESLSFPPIIAFGENSAYPHYRAGKARLQRDQWVLFDLGVVVDGYAGDMTRGVFFGKSEPRIAEDYQIIQRATAQAMKGVRPGATLREIDRLAREVLRAEKVESLFTHNLSHGVGLEVHEFPALREEGGDADVPLEPGMVFTIEPGLYRPGLGGVRYENTVLVTRDVVENFYPDEIL